MLAPHSSYWSRTRGQIPKVGQVETSFVTLDGVIKITNLRVNAELDELEREEFYRLKKIQAKENSKKNLAKNIDIHMYCSK